MPARPHAVQCCHGRLGQEVGVSKEGKLGRTLKRLAAGAAAGGVSKTLVAPLERVSTIIMTSAAPGATWRSALATMWQDGGLTGLYRGNAATLAKVGSPARCMRSGLHWDLGA